MEAVRGHGGQAHCQAPWPLGVVAEAQEAPHPIPQGETLGTGQCKAGGRKEMDYRGSCDLDPLSPRE